MRSLLSSLAGLAIVAGSAATVEAATVYIDFNSIGNAPATTTGPTTSFNGNTWNTIAPAASPAQPLGVHALVDADGNASGISVGSTGVSFDFSPGVTTSDAWMPDADFRAAYGVIMGDTTARVWEPIRLSNAVAATGVSVPWAPLTASGDFFFSPGQTKVGALALNLQAGQQYDIELLSSVGGTSDRLADFSLRGSDATSLGTTYANFNSTGNTSTTMTWTITAPTDGVVWVVSDGVPHGSLAGGRFNAMQISAVPEPAAIGLLGLGGVALLRRRRNA